MQRSKAVLLVPVILLFLVANGLGAEILTNDTIVTMVKASLSEELILSKIKTSQNQFDVSTESILKLKGEGVGEKIIQAMIEASTKPGFSEPKTTQTAVTHPMAAYLGLPPTAVLQGQSLYVKAGEKVLEMPPVVPGVQHSMAKHFIPFYFGPGDNWHYLRGQKSVVRVTNRKPAFYTKTNPSAFLLTKLSYDSPKDIRYVVSTGATFRGTIPIAVNKISDDFFELSPREELQAGEYAFVSTATFYDFGIE
jgi:hypothetical protein